MANKEVYSLGISIKVDGDSEAKKKISNLESATEKVEKKFKNLSQLTASPTSKIKDLTTPIVEKIESKARKLNSTSISPTVKLIDGASSKLEHISTTIKRLDNANITANVRINDQTSTYLNKVHSHDDKLKNTSVNPTAEVSDSNIGNKISSAGDYLSTRVTLPLIGLGAAAAKVGMDFESQMSRVKAISGATGNEFEKLHDQSLQLGADTAFSAKLFGTL
ncbi:phage tail tape measure protein [Clostridium sp. YIM B02555]|uniref:phage tail tape measure protein n=1 Tax=Clostridium sp. YIM B02555 TaxID=2911968 RepID=UPI001EEEC2D0|nr:phage tail tape measure protein [Clostridium sp. YIM B02555]